MLRGGEQRGDVERACPTGCYRRVEVKREDGQEHDDGTGQCVEEEFDGGIEAAVATPDGDEEIHGDEHHFPENVEEEEIKRNEDADHAGLEEEKQNVVFLGAEMNGAPEREDGNHAEECRDNDEQQADAVNAEKIFGANEGDAFGAYLQRYAAPSRFEPTKQRKRDQEAERAKDVAGDFVSL